MEVPIVSENKFSVLDDDDDGGSTVTVSEMDEDIQPKTPKIPPIKVLSKINNIKAFHEELTKIAKDVHFRSYTNTSNIITYNKVDHEAVKKFLEEKKVEFHTFSIKTELCRKLVLKGLDRSYTAEEVMSDLKIQSKNVKQVKQMTTRDRTYNAETAAGAKQPRPKIGVYMVYVSRDTILKEFTEEIRYVLRHKITWEKPSANRQIATQCTRCARWGHAGHNCGMHKRCLICSGSHTLAEHKAVQEKSQKPDAVKCPNCKDISYRNILAGRGGRPTPDIQHIPPQGTGQTPNPTNFLEGERNRKGVEVQARTKAPFQIGILMATKSLQSLFANMRTKYEIRYILTNRLCQDVLEHFFSLIRKLGGLSDHPHCLDFMRRFKRLICGSRNSVISTEANIQDPETPAQCVTSFETISHDVISSIREEEDDELNSNDEDIDVGKDTIEEAGLEYVAGYVAKRRREDQDQKILGTPSARVEESEASSSSWVFSNSVASVLMFLGEKGLLKSKNWKLTSEVIKVINDWFDVMNSRVPSQDSRDRTKAYGLALFKQNEILEKMIAF
uniref:Transposable element P transposase-like GTP-binding insertion domain-containing protein n=1 Tax=Phlebotomus papatasi TaxID=29031 RepID=A0A1B0DH88_PHLPP